MNEPKKIPRCQKDTWGRSLDAVGQAASIIASARASITTLVCWDYQLRLPLLRHVDSRSWTSLVIILSASRLVQDPLVNYRYLLVGQFERVWNDQKSPISLYRGWWPFYSLYPDNLFHKHNILSKVQENVAVGRKRGYLTPPTVVPSRTTYDAQCPVAMSCGTSVRSSIECRSGIQNWCVHLHVVRTTPRYRSRYRPRYRIHAQLMPCMGFGSRTRPISLEWFKECARYAVLIWGTGDTGVCCLLR